MSPSADLFLKRTASVVRTVTILAMGSAGFKDPTLPDSGSKVWALVASMPLWRLYLFYGLGKGFLFGFPAQHESGVFRSE